MVAKKCLLIVATIVFSSMPKADAQPTLLGKQTSNAIEKFGAFDQTYNYNVLVDLYRDDGYQESDGSWAIAATGRKGHMLYGPYASWGTGGGMAVFRIKTDNNIADNQIIAELEIHDATTGKNIGTRMLRRRDFYEANTYQDFEVWFDINSNEANHRFETRVNFRGGAYIAIKDVVVHFDNFSAGFPAIHNTTDASDAHVANMAKAAIGGLYYDWLVQMKTRNPGATGNYALDAPSARDLLFVGKYYMAWIDQTGFYGKINALWILNGKSNTSLDFVHRQGDGRVVNFLIVAENGDGRWPSRYTGAEHYEMPNFTQEYPGDHGGGVDRTGQYSLNEASSIDGPALWSACNRNTMAWTRQVRPVARQTFTVDGGGLKVVYQGPLTKRADDGGKEENCHGDFQFGLSPERFSEPGVRRTVFLRVGYKLYANQPHLDRLYQIDNPAGNPEFGHNNWGLIGGLVLTQWPKAHPLKANLPKFVQSLTSYNKVLQYADQRLLVSPSRWTYNRNEAAWKNPSRDALLAWFQEGYGFSSYSYNKLGSTLQQALFGPAGKEIGDVGFCFCIVHGGLEIGGSVLNAAKHVVAGQPFIIPGGSTSGVVTRRISFPKGNGLHKTYEAETDTRLSHAVGRHDRLGWSAATGRDNKGYMIFGPYAKYWGVGTKQALFRILIDETHVKPNEKVASIEVFDASTGTVQVHRDLYRRDFPGRFQYQDFGLNFSNGNNTMETRVYWHDTSYVNVDNIRILDLD